MLQSPWPSHVAMAPLLARSGPHCNGSWTPPAPAPAPQEPARGPIIRHRYDWPAALEDAIGNVSGQQPYFTSLKSRCCNGPRTSEGFEGAFVLKP